METVGVTRCAGSEFCLRIPIVVLLGLLLPGVASLMLRGWREVGTRSLLLLLSIPLAFVVFGPLWGGVLFATSSEHVRNLGVWPFLAVCVAASLTSLFLTLRDRRVVVARLAPPVDGAPVIDPAPVDQATPAFTVFWRRCAALAVDLALLFCVLAAIALSLDAYNIAAGAPRRSLPLIDPVDGNLAWHVVRLALGVLHALYFSFFESSRWQATPGKRLLGLRVSTVSGLRLSLFRAFARTLAKAASVAVVFIGLLMPLFTKRRQALHDMLSGCVVSQREAASSKRVHAA